MKLFPIGTFSARAPIIESDGRERRGKHMPLFPRALLSISEKLVIVILPQVRKYSWEPMKDRWVLPGCKVLTTNELCALAADRGWSVNFSTEVK